MILFDSEKNRLKDHELNKLLGILKEKPIRLRKYDTVYEALQAAWEVLNEREVVYIEENRI